MCVRLQSGKSAMKENEKKHREATVASGSRTKRSQKVIMLS